MHRIQAAGQAGLSDFPADVRPGSERDALLFAIAANAAHGLPRSTADKEKAVNLLLADAEWSQWNDHEIARHCRVSQNFVSKLRRRASSNGLKMRPRRVRRGNQVYEMRPKAKPEDPAAAAAAPPPPAAPPPAATDRLGRVLSADAGPAFAALTVFDAAEKVCDQLAGLVDQLARAPGGAAYLPRLVPQTRDGKTQLCAPELLGFLRNLRAAAPHCGCCPRCRVRYAGRVHPACKRCGGRGWLSRADFDACPEAERQELRRLPP